MKNPETRANDHDKQLFFALHKGSATNVCLDYAEKTSKIINNTSRDDNLTSGHCPPWGEVPSLKQRCEAAGIDQDKFLQYIHDNLNDEQIADYLSISADTVKSLKDYFFHQGLDSVQGQD